MRMIFKLVAGMAVVMMTMSASEPAAAFGDRCYQALKGNGRGNSLEAARGQAIAKWQTAARNRHGAAAANWNYSADRGFDCSWNGAATQYKCAATAGPCQSGG